MTKRHDFRMEELPEHHPEQEPSPEKRSFPEPERAPTLLERLLTPLFDRLFAPVEYPPESAEKLCELAQTHTLVYVSRTRSTWLALYLNYIFKTLKLPPAAYLGSIIGLFAHPVRYLLRLLRQTQPPVPGPWIEHYTEINPTEQETRLANITYRGGSSFFNLTPPRSIGRAIPRFKNDFIRALVAVQRVSEKPICVVPHILTDKSMGGGGKQTVTDKLFGDKRRPGKLRGMAIRVRTYRTAIIRVGEPLFLQQMLEENPEANDATLVKKIRHHLNRTITEEERVIAGPDLPSYVTQERHVLRNPLVRDTLSELAQETGQSPEELEEQAAKLLKEIAAKFDARYVNRLDALLNGVFNRIYDGIVCDREGLARVMEASRKGPIVFCPCHKSHVDYLVLSHLLWRTGMTPPHIAAGVNLSFFPLGPIFRGCGAFFLRRSFKGNKLYSAVFRSYVMELIGAGTSIEFFLEGTRSRTGKLLMPKFGILGMVVEAWRRGAREDIQFVPVSIDYEKIIEAKSYEKEISGGKKKKEDITALFKTTSVLRSKFGRMHVQFGEPISLQDFAHQRALPQSIDPEGEESWRVNTERLGYHILHGISQVCTVTPTAVVATVLLGHQGRGLSRSMLVDRSQAIVHYLDTATARLSAPLQQETTQRAAITEAVEKLVDDNAVDAERTSRGDAEPIYHIPDKNRVHLDFHKNSLINHFAPGSLLARVLVQKDREDFSYDKIRKDTRFLSRLFKREFAYRVGSIFANVFDETLATLAVRGMLDAHEDGTIGVLDAENLQVLAGLLDNFVEAYWITSMTLRELRTFPLWEKELITRAQDQARRAYLEGKIQRPEAVNSTLISSALKWFQDSGVITSRISAKRKTLSLSSHYSGDALEKLIESIGRFV